jgi:hypothetical protein
MEQPTVSDRLGMQGAPENEEKNRNGSAGGDEIHAIKLNQRSAEPNWTNLQRQDQRVVGSAKRGGEGGGAGGSGVKGGPGESSKTANGLSAQVSG